MNIIYYVILSEAMTRNKNKFSVDNRMLRRPGVYANGMNPTGCNAVVISNNIILLLFNYGYGIGRSGVFLEFP